MKRWIENVRKQSDRQKHVTTFSIAIGLTAVIFIVWLTTLSPRLNNTKDEAIVSRVSPLSDLRSNVASTFESIGVVWEDMALAVQNLFSNDESTQPTN
jgi:hypothetical protein